jgi:putative endonuclease
MTPSRRSWVYILASRKNGTLYVGVTTDLRTRMSQHKDGRIEGFTKQYRVNTLVYFEEFKCIQDAIAREKMLKGWNRLRKISLIESANADWDDLTAKWFLESLGPSRGSG